LNGQHFKAVAFQNIRQRAGFFHKPAAVGYAEPLIAALSGKLNQLLDSRKLRTQSIGEPLKTLRFLYRCQARKFPDIRLFVFSIRLGKYVGHKLHGTEAGKLFQNRRPVTGFTPPIFTDSYGTACAFRRLFFTHTSTSS